ncbi:MAG: PAS domain-containing protein, partial [Bdellovibrionota bacterium]
FTPQEFAGQSAAERIHPDDIPEFRNRVAEFARGTPSLANADRRYRHKDGHYIWLSISSNMLRNKEGRPTHILGIFQDISRRKNQERETHETRNHLNTILESVRDVVWSFSVPEKRLSFMNQTATQTLFQRSPQEFYDNPELWLGVVHEDDRERVAGMKQQLPTGSSEDFYRILRPSGEIRWVHMRTWATLGVDGYPIRVEGVIRDITEARLSDQLMRESEARLQLVIAAGKFGIFEIDPATGSTFWTSGMRELLGLPPDHPASIDSFEKLIHPDDLESARREIAKLGKNDRNHLPAIRIIRPDGSLIWVQGFARLVHSHKLLGAIMDVTEAKEAEQLIEAQRAKLAAAAKMSALGEMAGGLAHEIMNPLAIIHGNAVLLKQQADRSGIKPAALKAAAETIEHTSDRISKIVKSLRAFARDVEQDPFQLVSVKNIIEETAELCRARFRDCKIEFHIDPIDESLKIESRPVQISQVLLNLLNNAFDAVEKMPSPWIRINILDARDSVQIQVTDCGRGIPPGVKEKLFQPFFTTKEIGKGTGLGLSVSSGIIETHSGILGLDSSHSNTRFVVTLPKRQR